jgi:hypothetical protein
MHEANLAGLKYFMYILSCGYSIPYVDTDIRKIIWDYAVEPPYIILRVVNTISIKLSVTNNGIKTLPI